MRTWKKTLIAVAMLLALPRLATGAQALTADRVQETTTTTGTGTVTLDGAVTGFRTFASAFSTGNLIQYAIVSTSGTEWEVGNGTLATTSTLSRDTVIASSNSNNAVSFSAGTKKVFATVTGTHVNTTVLGPTSATDECIARWDTTTGKLIQDSVVCITDAGLVTGVARLDVDNLRLDANTLSSTNTNGNIVLAPNGTGQVTLSAGSAAKPAIAFAGDPDVGFAQVTAPGSNWMDVIVGGAIVARFDSNGIRLVTNKGIFGDGGGYIGQGVVHFVTTSTAGVGSPQALASTNSFDTQTNQGSTAKNYKTLPGAIAGYTFPICVQDADGIRVTAAAGDTIRQGASVTATGGYIESTTQGACLTLQGMNTDEWFVLSTNDIATNSWTFN